MNTFLPVTLIIPTYFRKDRLVLTLQSYLNGVFVPNQIIVVDQSPKDVANLIQEEIKRLSDLVSIEYVYSDIQSITYARNIGLNLAKNEIVIFSDDDVDVSPDVVELTYKKMLQENVGLVCAPDFLSPKQNLFRRTLSYFCGYRSYKKRNFASYSKSVYGSYPSIQNRDDVYAEWAMGFYFSVKKSIIEKNFIYFDEKLRKYSYAEDLDFSLRYCSKCKELGLNCFLLPYLHVEHKKDSGGRENEQLACNKIFVNRYYLYFKLLKPKKVGIFYLKWSNFCTIFRNLGKKKFKYFIHSSRICKKYKKRISQGDLAEEMYE